MPASDDFRTTDELRDAGRAARAMVPFADHADAELPARDPVEILIAQNATREPDFVRLRTGAITLTDLARDEYRADVRTCGALLARAHAPSANLAAIAGPLGDLADFDETIGSWAAASVAVVRRDYERVRGYFAPDRGGIPR